MKCLELGIAIVLFLLVVWAAFRAIYEPKWKIRRLDADTAHAYGFLVVCAVVLFAAARLDLHINSLNVWGITADVKSKVESLSAQMEVFYKTKAFETFDKSNWDRLTHVSGKTKLGGPILQVELKQEPIPGSVEVYEGVILMPQIQYVIIGRDVQFPANVSTPEIGLTITYYPRVKPSPQP
jgi:hypothetical protein